MSVNTHQLRVMWLWNCDECNTAQSAVKVSLYFEGELHPFPVSSQQTSNDHSNPKEVWVVTPIEAPDRRGISVFHMCNRIKERAGDVDNSEHAVLVMAYLCMPHTHHPSWYSVTAHDKKPTVLLRLWSVQIPVLSSICQMCWRNKPHPHPPNNPKDSEDILPTSQCQTWAPVFIPWQVIAFLAGCATLRLICVNHSDIFQITVYMQF